MTPEITVLALAGLLQGVQFVLMAVPANLELGPHKTLSPRDPQAMQRLLMEQVSPVTGRLYRALDNHFEGLILFSLAVVVVTLSDRSSAFTTACAWTYLRGPRPLYPRLCHGPRPMAFGHLVDRLRRDHGHDLGEPLLMASSVSKYPRGSQGADSPLPLPAPNSRPNPSTYRSHTGPIPVPAASQSQGGHNGKL